MEEIKFRQPIYINSKFHHWFYWGFIDGVFIAPAVLKAPNFQFIGLKDVRGTDIYKGDIVHLFLPAFNIDENRLVEWDDKKAGYITLLEEWHRTIVGNSIENPELL